MSATLDSAVIKGLPLTQQDVGRRRSPAPTPSGSRSGPCWFVVATYGQAERQASRNLRDQGYQTYLPFIALRRRDPVVRSMSHTIEAPLFPGYLFCRFDAAHDPWRPIQNTPGVFSLLRSHDTGLPHRVPEGIVEALQATEDARRHVGPPSSQWAPGTPCSLALGAFRGHDAVVIAAEPRRVVVGVMCFGAVRQISVAPDCLVARE